MGANTRVERRTLLKGIGVGSAGIVGAPLLVSCTGKKPDSSSSKKESKTSFGSNYSDPIPKKAIASVVKAFEKKTDDIVKINTVSHNDFQEHINSYLQGKPDLVFAWFSGIRMKAYAKKGLTLPVDDIWDEIESNFPSSIAKASTADDKKKYLIPWTTYPWAVFYNKELFTEKGYEVPKKWDDFKKLCSKMKTDDITPLAFADKDLWPACGTFDYINMRLNGYQFHVDLMAHEESWNQKKVHNVFDHWKSILPYHQKGSLDRKWQDAADTIVKKTSGMYVIGLDQIGAQVTGDKAANIDFFPFPEMDPEHGQDAVEAPIDGFMLSKQGRDDKTAKEFLKYLGSAAAQKTYLKTNHSSVASAKGVDTSQYNELQKKSVKLINNAGQLSQFLDRDSLPAFASDVMEPALQHFIRSGKFNAKSVESQAKQKYKN